MTVAQMIAYLERVPMEERDKEILVDDSIGPADISTIHRAKITEQNADDCGNCEGKVGQEVFLITLNY